MLQAWKVPQILKGVLTYVPAINTLRVRRGSTGGSSSARYCYTVWLRHLVVLHQYGFNINGAVVTELGPGDSIGTGLAALLSGAHRYVGLDAVPFSRKANLEQILSNLIELYAAKEPIPDEAEFPSVRPQLKSYDFPHRLIDVEHLPANASRVMSAIEAGLDHSDVIAYHAPWNNLPAVACGSVDLVFSQAVLQYVDDLKEAYSSMFAWLRPGGYCSHSTGLGANNFSPFWNGHWAYTEFEWRMVRGRREFLLNRQPLSTHLILARDAGFEILHVDAQYDRGGLPLAKLAQPFRTLAPDDLLARGAMFVLRKPPTPRS